MNSKYIFNHFILMFFVIGTAFTAGAQNGKFKVVLDAGHGGKDFGAIYSGHIEKNIALGVVLKVGKLLEKNPNIDVVYTRKSDVFVELDERANIANREDASIFVSIHCNANANPVAEGFETYIMGVARNASNLEVAKKENGVITLEKDYKQVYEGYNPNSPESMIGIMMQQEAFIENSIALASRIQENFDNSKSRKNRGVRQAGFLVLRKIAMPRILVEMGFISNPAEGKFLDSDEGQQDLAEDIANAIISYKKEYYGSGSNDKLVEKSKTVSLSRTVDTPSIKTADSNKVKDSEKDIKKDVRNSDAGGIVYKIQLSAGVKKLELKPSNFKGLNNISVTEEGRLYKYTYEETGDYNQAKKFLSEAKGKGFSTAYIIALRDGEKISVQEAIKSSNN